MNRVVLTEKKIARLRAAAPGTSYDLADALVPLLCVRVTDTGSKAFIFRSRFPNKPYSSRRVLGKVGALSVEAARAKARKWHELLANHVDPAYAAEQARLAALRAQNTTFLSVAEAWFAHLRAEGVTKAKAYEREVCARSSCRSGRATDT
jgi:hypothetical protein